MKQIGNRFYAEESDIPRIKAAIKKSCGLDVDIKIENGRFVIVDDTNPYHDTHPYHESDD